MPLSPTHPALFGVGPRGMWLALRTLHTVHGLGWVRYVGQRDDGRVKGHHLLDLAPTDQPAHPRLLYAIPSFWTSPRHPGEVWYWGQGLAAARRKPTALDGLLAERTPQLVDIPTAAQRLGIVPGWRPGQRSLWQQMMAVTGSPAGQFYAVHVVDERDHRTRRMVFAAQVAADGGKAPAVARWRELRALLPDQPRLNTHAEPLAPRPSPVPLPVEPLMRTPQRQREALALADELGWLRFEGSSGNVFAASVLPGPRRNLRVELPAQAVEPFLLGLGDGLGGQGSRVAYRADLG